jgi:hypothetical protein
VKDVQSFLGFCNFYRRFIYGYSGITVPLTRLTRIGKWWDWTPACQAAFNTLKSAFTAAPVLHHWIPGVEVQLVPHVAFNSHANSMFQPNIPANRDQVLFCFYTHSLLLILPLLTQISHYQQNSYFTSYILPTRQVQLKSSAISDYAGD